MSEDCSSQKDTEPSGSIVRRNRTSVRAASGRGAAHDCRGDRATPCSDRRRSGSLRRCGPLATARTGRSVRSLGAADRTGDPAELNTPSIPSPPPPTSRLMSERLMPPLEPGAVVVTIDRSGRPTSLPRRRCSGVPGSRAARPCSYRRADAKLSLKREDALRAHLLFRDLRAQRLPRPAVLWFPESPSGSGVSSATSGSGSGISSTPGSGCNRIRFRRRQTFRLDELRHAFRQLDDVRRVRESSAISIERHAPADQQS